MQSRYLCNVVYCVSIAALTQPVDVTGGITVWSEKYGCAQGECCERQASTPSVVILGTTITTCTRVYYSYEY